MAKNTPKKKTKKKKSRKLLWIILSIFVVFLAGASVGGYYLYEDISAGIPSLEELENPQAQLASRVYSADGELIARYYLQNRVETSLDSIPKHLVNALIATEDLKYYDHWGVNVERIIKALTKYFILGGKRQGGSTITQQLAKNLYKLKKDKESGYDTVVRKLTEFVTAVQLEKAYTKNEILEMYLNTNYLGQGTYGVDMAAKAYFGKNISQLNVQESAVIIALCNLPYKYDPFRNYNNALKKRNQIMYNMVRAGYLPEKEYHELKKLPITLTKKNSLSKFSNTIAPHYIEHLRKKLEKLKGEYGFDLYEDGLVIQSTLDSRIQKIANKVVNKHISEFQKKFDKYWNWEKHKDILDDIVIRDIRGTPSYVNAKTSQEKVAVINRLKKDKTFVDSVKSRWGKIEVGFIATDVKTGEILAMVGGRNTSDGRGWNHVTQIRRQPGSAFKPIVYSVALDNGLYPAYPILNQPFEIDGWRPENFNKKYSGFMTMRGGLKQSKNVISARLIVEGHAPTYQVKQYAKKMGITTNVPPYYSISLGTAEVSPIDMAGVYGTLANKGIYTQPYSLKNITDKDGILIEKFVPETREALSESTSYLMVDMMRDVIKEGTGIRIWSQYQFLRDCAGKTGTTQDYRNAWFCGFTPQIAAVVWVGFDDERIYFDGPDSYGQGARAAMPIWAMFMKELYDTIEFPEEKFEMPMNGEISRVDFCDYSIYELGKPKLWSTDCDGIKITDLVKTTDAPMFYNSRRDTSINIFTKYMGYDSTSHEALEIREIDSTKVEN